MRNLRWPRFWLGLWISAIAAVIVLSLVPPPSVPLEATLHIDKLLHFFAYFALAFGAVQLFRRGRTHACIALGLIALGIALEWAQGTLVPHLRMFDLWDALANLLGVLAGMALAATPLAGCVQGIESRLSGQ